MNGEYEMAWFILLGSGIAIWVIWGTIKYWQKQGFNRVGIRHLALVIGCTLVVIVSMTFNVEFTLFKLMMLIVGIALVFWSSLEGMVFDAWLDVLRESGQRPYRRFSVEELAMEYRQQDDLILRDDCTNWDKERAWARCKMIWNEAKRRGQFKEFWDLFMTDQHHGSM